MRVRNSYVLAGCAVLLGTASVAYRAFVDPAPPRRPLRLGVNHNPPYTVKSETGQWEGIALEVVTEAARRRNIPLELVEAKPENGRPDSLVARGEVDLWPLMLDAGAQQDRRIYVTEKWMQTWHYLIALQKSSIVKLEDIKGGTVAIPETSEFLSKLGGVKTSIKKKRDEVFEAVCTGNVAAGILETRSVQAALFNRPPSCVGLRLYVSPIPDSSLSLGVGSTLESTRWADVIRNGIGEMARDGTLTAIFSKWMVITSKEVEALQELSNARRRGYYQFGGMAALFILFLVTAWQVRQVRSAQRVAERANRAKSEFLANMSHEIRTPISGIVGLAWLLAQEDQPAGTRETAAQILESSEALLGVINDILDFSKIEAGMLKVEKKGISLHDVVVSSLEISRFAAERKGLRFEIVVEPDVPEWVQLDPLRLRQVLINLAGNAVKFTANGSVAISVRRVETQLRFEIADTGIGIDPANRSQVFDPFVQADASTSRKFGGTGLGLSICRRLVQLMDGELGVKSTIGKGSTFWFALPLIEFEPAARKPEAPVAASLRPTTARHILVAEDNRINQKVAVALLTRLGHSVDAVSTGAEAVEAAAACAYDLILMDCQMPVMDGYDASREIQSRLKNTRCPPIVALTASAMQGDRERCLQSGMQDYLTKPVSLEELQSTIDKWAAPPMKWKAHSIGG
ncbi:MAG: response regulator [Candidatus Solibacter usitatus]|nr:response regulator [Candidatus Solibacter usitatus]